jgi:hypothetical protein
MTRGLGSSLLALAAGVGCARAWPTWPEDLRAAAGTLAPVLRDIATTEWRRALALAASEPEWIVPIAAGIAGMVLVLAVVIVSRRSRSRFTEAVRQPPVHRGQASPAAPPPPEVAIQERVARLARAGRPVGAIAAETQLAQDAVRLLLASR